MYVKVSDLPAPIQQALESVGYGKKDIDVSAAVSVALASPAYGDGFRGFTILVNLTSGRFDTRHGSWGGSNPWDKGNPVDNDENTYTLPGDGVAIRGQRGGGHPVHATLHIPASMVSRMLPGPPVDVTPEERAALNCYAHVRAGAYRKEALERAHVTAATIDRLIERGWLTRNRAGACTITTAGKNVAG